MQTATIQDTSRQEGVNLPVEYVEPRWYAAYTRANHEQSVRERLEQRSVESFLPMYETVRRWKDRRMRLRLPLLIVGKQKRAGSGSNRSPRKR